MARHAFRIPPFTASHLSRIRVSPASPSAINPAGFSTSGSSRASIPAFLVDFASLPPTPSTPPATPASAFDSSPEAPAPSREHLRRRADGEQGRCEQQQVGRDLLERLRDTEQGVRDP